ncbi:hypothetical protein M433DRAFT_2971 [Acidomyces richmondensis BFW]|nr:MAG: hypothetical protein FE78DRAFT_29414 [Acidomyces sp. 'richmondensis']KYG47287.1 hypothetical protein M433DRAFT_2971 [Acidomyces richmondensis BFW]
MLYWSTGQAFMDMLKLDLHPTIILLNNNGYKIERLIHGRDADYNTLPQLDYAGLAKVFCPDKPSNYWGWCARQMSLSKSSLTMTSTTEISSGCWRSNSVP